MRKIEADVSVLGNDEKSFSLEHNAFESMVEVRKLQSKAQRSILLTEKRSKAKFTWSKNLLW